MTGMFNWHYEVRGDLAAVRDAVRQALEQDGFRIDERPDGEWHAQQGEAPSFLSRMVSSGHEPIVLSIRFGDGQAPGSVAVDLHRAVFGASGMTRNAVEMAHLDKGYRAAAATLHDRLTTAGILLSSNE